MTRPSLRAALVLLVTYAALTAAAYLVGESYAAAWLPWWRLETSWLMPAGLTGRDVELATTGGEHLIVLLLATTEPHVLSGHLLPAGAALRSTTLQAYALHHAVIVWTALAAWPARSWRRKLTLLALGVPCVLITTSLDIPFVLVGVAKELYLESFAPARLAADPLVLYYTFMHGGGRLALALAGTLAVAIAVSGAAQTVRRRDGAIGRTPAPRAPTTTTATPPAAAPDG